MRDREECVGLGGYEGLREGKCERLEGRVWDEGFGERRIQLKGG